MFESLSIASQAMIWTSIIYAAGVAVIFLILDRSIKKQMERYQRLHRDQLDVLLNLLASDARSDKAEGKVGYIGKRTE